ncbi:MAG: hypothetical protein EHM46_01940 [Bacteroidetes bacterium]|nr:MAG: hypothetical protein EHM46_01940 [Bacteroidota bacterium]
MKRDRFLFPVFPALVLLILQGCQPGPAPGLVLEDTWKFRTGDYPAYAGAGYDHSDWITIRSGKTWEEQGFDGYDGYAWYRQEVKVSAGLRWTLTKRGGLVLKLGMIDDADITYWNGEIVGQTGHLPPVYQTAHGEERVYEIPADLVRWGRKNTIAVKVYDGGGGGGIYAGPVSLSVMGMEELVVIQPLVPVDHIFRNKGPVEPGLKIRNEMDRPLKGELEAVVVSDFGGEITRWSREMEIQKGGEQEVHLPFGELAPGFYRVSVSLSLDRVRKETGFSIGVRPEEILSPLDRPGDFREYWDRARKELAAVDPQFRLIRQDSLCTDTKEWFIVQMRSLDNVLIRGWYMRPVKEGVYPAILHVQGYSTFYLPGWMYPGEDMVALGLNIRGHGFSRDDVDPGFPGYFLHHIDDRDRYVYRGAYMDCIRAVDFLCSRREVDTTRIAVEGASQGGALSIAVAALDNRRISLCIPQVPFLSDFRDYFRITGWPAGEVREYLRQNPEVTEELVYGNLSYIDIKNLAPWVTAPVLMMVGLEDEVCPPHINFAAYNNLIVPREYMVFPHSGHRLPGSVSQLKYNRIRDYFNLN